MSRYLLDTNVISETRKARPDPRVPAWLRSVEPSDIFLSVLTLGEIRKGIELIRLRDPIQAATLEAWFTILQAQFADRILPVSASIVDYWGRFAAIRPTPIVDGLLAATAVVHSLTLVTRNTCDVVHPGVTLLNPFQL